MKNFMLKLYTKAQMLREDQGQDLIEYAMLAALVALFCVTTVGALATAINTIFTTIKTSVLAL